MAKSTQKIEKRAKQAETEVEKVGNALVEGFHLLMLFIIGATIVVSAGFAIVAMFNKGTAELQDVLLLFIYLELGAMVGIYFKTNHMPVRFLIYVAITALTRLLIEIVSVQHTATLEILLVTGGILILSVGVFLLRMASYRYPADPQARLHTDIADDQKTN